MTETTLPKPTASAAAGDRYPSRQAPEARITNRLDPVVYGRAETGPLDASQLGFYQDNGYLSLHQLFGPTELADCLAELQRLRSDDAAQTPPHHVAGVLQAHENRLPLYHGEACPRSAGGDVCGDGQGQN